MKSLFVLFVSVFSFSNALAVQTDTGNSKLEESKVAAKPEAPKPLERPAGLQAFIDEFKTAQKPTFKELREMSSRGLFCYKSPEGQEEKGYVEVAASLHSFNTDFPLVVNPMAVQIQREPKRNKLFLTRRDPYSALTNEKLVSSAHTTLQKEVELGEGILADEAFTRAEFLADIDDAFRATYHYAEPSVRPITYTNPKFNVAVKSKEINGKKEYFVKMQVDGGAGFVQIEGEENPRRPFAIYVCSTVAPATLLKK